MKRQGDRDSPNRGGSKRNRGRSPNRRHYRDNSPDLRDRETRISSRDARRTIQNRRRSPAYSPEINRNRRRNVRGQSEEYTTLVVSNFSNQLGKEDIENSLYYEFRKFGDVSLRITRDLDGNRIVFATFRSSDDAKECKNARGHLVMHDKRLVIEIARENNHDAEWYSPVDKRSSARARSPVVTRSPIRRRSPKRNVRNPPRDRSLARPRANYRERSPVRERLPMRERNRSFSYDRSPPTRNHYSSPERNSLGSRTPVKYRSISPRSSNSIRNRSISPRKGDSKTRENVAKNDEHTTNNDFSPKTPALGPSTNQNVGMQDQSGYYPPMIDKPIPPEDDPYATRTLFVGNLEVEIGSRDIRKLFSRFGKIEDIDVKRAPRGVGGYCFVRFSNLNEAYKAKITVNGKAIKKNIVRVGYGKVLSSSKIWVGGLGRWTKLSDLENEFDRFGSIRRIDFEKGDCSASILYETIDAAMAACNQMRGFLMPGAETRLRMDFLEPEPGMPGYEAFLEWGRHEGRASDKNQDSQRYRGRNVFVGDRNSLSPYSRSKSRRRSKHDATIIKETAATEMQIKQRQAKHCITLHDLCQGFDPPCWQGGFVLKKVAFPVLFFLLNGDMGILNTTTADPNSSTGRQTMLLMKKRLRLEENKLSEIKKRMKTCTKQTCLLVAVPGVPENLNMNVTLNGVKPIQHKPLRGLVKYLKEKSAAGIIQIPFITKDSHKNDNDDTDVKTSGFLHCFPPGSFASEQLLKIGPNLQPQMFADDYLVALLVKGEKSAIL